MPEWTRITNVTACRVFSLGRPVRRVRLTWTLGLLVLVCAGPGVGLAAGMPSREILRTSILALDSARDTAVAELSSPLLTDRERSDYRDFIAYLNTRIVTYCQQLQAQGAADLVAELPCPTAGFMSAAGADTSPDPVGTVPARPRATTRAERTDALHESFIESLGAFDQMLLEEEGRLATRVPSQREQGASGGGGDGADGGSPGAASSDEASGSVGEDAGAAGGTGEAAADASVASATGTGTGEASSSAPQGVPEGTLPPPEDDDIVARQLREAAEKETDPELKKKLWDEYWTYKRGVGR